MSGTPGQAAYEAFFGHFGMPHDWAASDGSTRAAWDAAAQAAIAAFMQQPMPFVTRELTEAEVADLRERFLAARNEPARVLADPNPWTERAAEILTEGQP